jgi:hypothetical protein
MKTAKFVVATLVVLALACPARAEDRSIDGTGNNLSDPNRGAVNMPMIRHGYKADFINGQMVTDAQRANARDISNAVSAQSASRPNARGLSDYIWAWGQFVSHDTDLVTSSNGPEVNGTAPISINSPQDPLGPSPIPFVRSNFVTEPRGGRTPINEVTSYIDASHVYGSNAARAAALRTDGGMGAKLLTSAGNLLPYNTAGLPNENNGPTPADQLFLAGDVRANENALLTSLHTIFTREHNRLVDVIAAQQPALEAEQQYQLARKIVGAELQIVTYREFLPALLGHGPTVPKAEGYAYSSGQNASVTTAFSHSAFRYGHSTVSPDLQLVNDDGTSAGSIALRNAFFNPSLLSGDPQLLDQLLAGATTQRSQEVDTLVVDDLRNFLFGPPGAGGLDLAALNIQRGRDAGLPDYRQLRSTHQLPTIQTFGQITSDPALAQALFDLYGGNINNVDLWVGGLAEDHVPGASVGLLTKAAIESQFLRLRDGDRLFYRGNAAGLYAGGVLTPEIAAIVDLDALRLSDVILANTSLTDIKRNVFFVPLAGDYNGDGQADAADYTVWRDTLGSTNDMSADGSGDGTVGPEDYNVWKIAASASSAVVTIVGDYSGDGEVDAADYSVWRDTLGSTINIAADGSGNGTVGPEDYNVWKSHFGQYVVKSSVGTLPGPFAVPEPSSAILVLTVVLLGHCLTRSRRTL